MESLKERIASKKAVIRGNIRCDPVANRVGGRIILMSDENIMLERIRNTEPMC